MLTPGIAETIRKLDHEFMRLGSALGPVARTGAAVRARSSPRRSTMIGRPVSELEPLGAVWQETRVWVNHLVGEGPATLRRQREAAAAALAAQRDLTEPRRPQRDVLHAAARPVLSASPTRVG